MKCFWCDCERDFWGDGMGWTCWGCRIRKVYDMGGGGKETYFLEKVPGKGFGLDSVPIPEGCLIVREKGVRIYE